MAKQKTRQVEFDKFLKSLANIPQREDGAPDARWRLVSGRDIADLCDMDPGFAGKLFDDQAYKKVMAAITDAAKKADLMERVEEVKRQVYNACSGSADNGFNYLVSNATAKALLLDISGVKDRKVHLAVIDNRMEVFLKGYTLLGELDGVFYVRVRSEAPADPATALRGST